MQVSQQADQITHAVVGQQESISMGVSDSAALMHILSSTLYTYPELAAVREVTCNGWDGHIMVGKTDVPLEISISASEFKVQDFGPGIPHDKIGQIYGVYGNSTKRDDSTQTGGFGLGSKAPFAVTDNFQVISCHEGVKTIYRVSKSSMEVGGKPSINKILDIPTDETGITVSFNIKDGREREYHKLIKEVLLLGGILARVNKAEPMEPLPLLESPSGFIISSATGTLLHRINVRYGNVVYPVPSHIGFKSEWDTVMSQMNKLWNSASIIFMASPDSVSIAPSREALIYTDETVATIKALLSQFTEDDIKGCEKTVKQFNREVLNKTIALEPPPTKPQDLERSVQIPVEFYPKTVRHDSGTYAYSIKGARMAYLLRDLNNVQEGMHVQVKLLKRAIKQQAFMDNKFARELLKAYYEHNNNRRSNRAYSRMTAIVHKFITYPIYQAIDSKEKMSRDRLYVLQNYVSNLVRFKERSCGDFSNAVGHLFKRVLIVRSKAAALEFLEREYRKNYERQDGWVVYVCHSHVDRINEAKAVFDKLDYEVHGYKLEVQPRIKKSDDPDWVPAERKASAKRKGYMTLRDSYDPVKETFLLSTAREAKEPANLKEPMAWIMLHNKSHHKEGRWTVGFGPEQSKAINQLWGDKIAVVTPAQAEALKKKGIEDMQTYVTTYVDDQLSAKQDFRRYLAFSRHLSYGHNNRPRSEVAAVVLNMLPHEELMKELGIRFHISAETTLLVNFLYGMDESLTPKCHLLSKQVKRSPEVDVVLNKVNQSKWQKFIDMSFLAQQLDTAKAGSEEQEIAFSVVKHLLK
ncbi:hypothetical protein D3C76_27620 [compost metagenome]